MMTIVIPCFKRHSTARVRVRFLHCGKRSLPGAMVGAALMTPVSLLADWRHQCRLYRALRASCKNRTRTLTALHTCFYQWSTIYYCYYGSAKLWKGSLNRMPSTRYAMQPSALASVMRRGLRSSRLLRSILIGLIITLVLICIEVALVWIVNPFQILGRDAALRLAVLEAWFVHVPLLLLIPLLELLVVAIVVFQTLRPLAILAYIRDVQKAQEAYRTTYTSLETLANVYPTPILYYQHTPHPNLLVQGEDATLLRLPELTRDFSLLLIGEAGTGKSLAVEQQLFLALQQRTALMRLQRKLPLSIPLRKYSLFLKMYQQANETATDEEATDAPPPKTLHDFFYESDLPGIEHVRPYLKRLLERGRLELLCDGLDEVDPRYRSDVSKELAHLLLTTSNRMLLTCRACDYTEQQDLLVLVNEGHIERVVIEPLQLGQVREFIERYIGEQAEAWQHTAGQLMQMIERSRLRLLCTNPLMLFTFLAIIDRVGMEQGRQLDTRGRLLRTYVAQRLEQTQTERRNVSATRSEVVRLLSRIACAARWSQEAYALQLPVFQEDTSDDALANALLSWLAEHPAHGPFAVDEQDDEVYEVETLSRLLTIARHADLIQVGSDGVLSFRHALIADYFVAEHFLAVEHNLSSPPTALSEDLLTHVAFWSVPVALWAGLTDTPLQMAEQLATFNASGVNSDLAVTLPRLAISLICLGVAWIPPQGKAQPDELLPMRLDAAFAHVVSDQKAREELAHIFTACAAEGTPEIYRALIPLLMVEGVEEFFVLLNRTVVLAQFFAYLQDTVDLAAYEAQVKRLCRVLWRFDGHVVAYASELSQPLAGRSVRLRAAAINILGGTQHITAVEPLLTRLADTEKVIVERAINALTRLGPELSLSSLLQELDSHTPGPSTRQTHEAALRVLERFLTEQDTHKQPTKPQQQQTLEALVLVLGSNYISEAEVQQQAREMLVAFGKKTREAMVGTPELVMTLLIKHLSSADEVLVRQVGQCLRELGFVATPYLAAQLYTQASEMTRVRIVEIFRDVRDPQALPDILQLIAEPSLLVQQQVTAALQVYDESIPGLIDLLLSSESEAVAERAMHILTNMGEEVVVPVAQALAPIVPGRTRLLVQVLDQVHDSRAIPALITLLKAAQGDSLLMVAVIRTLSRFSGKQVVSPLLEVLGHPQVQIYEEAINALSSLGPVAFDELVAALDVLQEAVTTSRIRRALLGMEPFPGERLLHAVRRASDAQAQQILLVLRMRGAEAADVLVQHLFDEDRRVRDYVRRILSEMPGPTVVPALLEVLDRPGWLEVVTHLLLRYSEAIPPLVDLLGDPLRASFAMAMLPQFGTDMLVPLVSGLDDPRGVVQESAQNIIVTLVHQNPAALSSVVRLFGLPLPVRAHQVLLDVLTNELAEVSIPTLLSGLEDAHLINDISAALARLAHKRDRQRSVLSGLLASLRVAQRRRGAEATLIKIGAPAVPGVGELITNQDQAVAQAAQHILRDIGVPALSLIWAAHGDMSNLPRRNAAMAIFHSMSPDVIKTALIDLLSSDRPEDVAMAQALLLERIHDEVKLPIANQEMIPALLEYVQIHERERTSLRVIALLLLLGGEAVVKHFVKVLYEYPEHYEQLAYAFLFLGEEGYSALESIVDDPQAPAKLRGEAISVLGLLGSNNDVYGYAQSLSNFGIVNNRAGVVNAEQLGVALRALGSLLVSGDWDVPGLQNMRRLSEEGSAQSELYSVLLGWRYTPELERLKVELQNEREARKNEVIMLTARIVEERAQIHELEGQLEEVRHEHGMRGDELFQATQEREAIRQNFEQSVQEKESLQQNFTQVSRERNVYRTSLDQALQEKQALQAEVEQLESYNTLLQQQLTLLRDSKKIP